MSQIQSKTAEATDLTVEEMYGTPSMLVRFRALAFKIHKDVKDSVA